MSDKHGLSEMSIHAPMPKGKLPRSEQDLTPEQRVLDLKRRIKAFCYHCPEGHVPDMETGRDCEKWACPFYGVSARTEHDSKDEIRWWEKPRSDWARSVSRLISLVQPSMKGLRKIVGE